MAKYPDRFHSTDDVLWYERRVELACEGNRWYDIVRSGRAKRLIAKELNSSGYTHQWQEHDIYIPVGSIELTSCNGSLNAYPDEEYSYTDYDLEEHHPAR